MRLQFWKKPRKDQISTVLHVYETNIGMKCKDTQEKRKWQACGMGAKKLLQDLQWLQMFEVADTLSKARLCLELGLQPMLTIWEIERGPASSEEIVRKDYARVQDLIDDLHFTLTKDTVDLYMNFDRELRGYLSSLVYPRENYAGMFHLRYRECVSTDRILNLKALGVEAETWKQFLEDCRGYCSMMLDPQEIDEFYEIFNEATSYMLEKYDTLEQAGMEARLV